MKLLMEILNVKQIHMYHYSLLFMNIVSRDCLIYQLSTITFKLHTRITNNLCNVYIQKYTALLSLNTHISSNISDFVQINTK